jgi:hypothetical protein
MLDGRFACVLNSLLNLTRQTFKEGRDVAFIIYYGIACCFSSLVLEVDIVYQNVSFEEKRAIHGESDQTL